MESATQNTMSHEEFVKTREFLALTENQRRWCLSFIETGDAVLALMRAYPQCKDKGQAYISMFAKKTESSPNVIAALDVYFQRSDREKFLRDLAADIKTSTGIAKIEGMRLLAKMKFGISGLEAPGAEKMPATIDCGVPDQPKIPEGCTAWFDKTTGCCVGYRTPEGEDVELS
jgi:hypothetical protein